MDRQRIADTVRIVEGALKIWQCRFGVGSATAMQSTSTGSLLRNAVRNVANQPTFKQAADATEQQFLSYVNHLGIRSAPQVHPRNQRTESPPATTTETPSTSTALETPPSTPSKALETPPNPTSKALETPLSTPSKELETPPVTPSKALETPLSTPSKAVEAGPATASAGSSGRTRRTAAVPTTAVERALRFGGLAAGLAWGGVQAYWRKGRGKKEKAVGEEHSPTSTPSPSQPQTSDSPPSTLSFLMTEENAERLASALCRMRGAALKLGQMLSIQDENIISPQVQRILERVRHDADIMPRKQTEQVLRKSLGDDWMSNFSDFHWEPMAAASIGQVHRAVVKSTGLEVALKLQYPGVLSSISSDLRNVARLLRATSALPKGLYLDKAVEEARRELTAECDYRQEAQNQLRFRELLSNEPDYYVPRVVPELSTESVLTTEYVYGLPVDEVAKLPQDHRDWVASRILKLCLAELFRYRTMQTDPNWSNFFYDPDQRCLKLIDFGACREYDKLFMDEYLKVVWASAMGDRETIRESATKMGFLTGDETEEMVNATIEAALIVGSPFSPHKKQPYDFATEEKMTAKLNQHLPTFVKHRLRPPPVESYTLHRKLSGAVLLCMRLGAKLDGHQYLSDVYHSYKFGPEK